MKIFFSTLFNQSSYPLNIYIENGVATGACHMGPLALLDHLELHLGISSKKISEGSRILKYRSQLDKVKVGSFFEKSFDASDIEVSRYLLNLRDELKLAGWDFWEQPEMPVRLKDFSNVEAAGNLPASVADRFRIVLDWINKGGNTGIVEILVYEWKNRSY